MIKPNIPDNEDERLKELKSYSILDTLPEEDYDSITKIAAEICGTKISLVSLIDSNRQWFKSHYGLDVPETHRDYAFCAHAINNPEIDFIVNDAKSDKRFYDNPLVTGEPNIGFYAGVSLTTKNGLSLGTLCVIDNQPKNLTQSQLESLKGLAKQVMNLLHLRKNNLELELKNKELAERNVALQQFASIAAHDLKSPLAGIIGLSDILLDPEHFELEENVKDIIKRIKSSSYKLNNLINGLLNYSKSINLLKEEKVKIMLEDLFSDLKQLLIRDKSSELILNTDLTSIITNHTAIQQILINLVANALKYNDKNEPKIEIKIWENDKFVNFSVKDNGPGISKENHERIFNIFAVLDSKDRYGERGTGLGLALVKRLVEGLGGEVKVESEPGNGTMFKFFIKK